MAGQRRQHRVLHPLLLRAAAVDHLYPAACQQRAAVAVQGVVAQPSRRLLVAQTQDAVRLAGAHLLHEPDLRPVPLVVAQRADGVDEVGLFAVHILRQKAAVPGHRLQQHLAHQLRHRLQQLFAVGCEGVVDEVCGKADALALPLLADDAVHRSAVQRIHGGGQALHIRVAHGAAAQHGGQQRIGGRGGAIQSGDEIQRQAAGFEFAGGQIGQEYIRHDLPAIFIHGGTSSVFICILPLIIHQH